MSFGLEKSTLLFGIDDAAGLIILAIIVIAALAFALYFLSKLGWFSTTTTTTTTIPTITWQEVMEEVAQKKIEWDNLVNIFENGPTGPTLPDEDECKTLKAVRDAVAQKITQAQGLGAPTDVIAAATSGLREINDWLQQWGCSN